MSERDDLTARPVKQLTDELLKLMSRARRRALNKRDQERHDALIAELRRRGFHQQGE